MTEEVTGEDMFIVVENLKKQITELEEAKANLEYLLEGRDNEIDELKTQIKVLEQNLEDTEICENGWKNRVTDLEAQIKEKEMLLTSAKITAHNEGADKIALLKENAELKAKNKWYSEQVCNKECAEVWENLTKAKDILTKILQRIPSFQTKFFKDLALLNALSEAEQFLNGEGCPDVMCDDCNRECELEKLEDSEVEMTNEVFGREEIENRLETEKLNELFSKIEVEDIMKKPTKPRNKRIIDFGELECVTKNKI